MTASEILKMIETVSPDDGVGLDAIDRFTESWLVSLGIVQPYSEQWNGTNPEYTRSRDALKAIRPEGYGYHSTDEYGEWHVGLVSPDRLMEFTGIGRLEELAELHAIIQAIEFERKA